MGVLETIKESLVQGAWDDVVELCGQNAQTLASEPLFYLYRGAAYTHFKKLKEAEADFLQAMQLDRTLVACYKNLGQLYIATKNPRAQEMLLKASWLDPGDEHSLETLLRVYGRHYVYDPADVVFYTGTPWLEFEFSPLSLQSALGGSETAFVMMAKSLSELGKRVLCFCNTPKRAVYGNVEYVPVEEFFVYAIQHETLTLVSSRFLHPFAFGRRAKRQILWCHDIQGCVESQDGDQLPRDVDELFVLSEYHQSVLQQRFALTGQQFFRTRNGFITEIFPRSLPQKKNRYSLIYISRPERGLKEALQVFSALKLSQPQATFHVCSYTQEKDMADDEALSAILPLMDQEGVEYHGGLSKQSLADLLSKTEIMLYPNVTLLETSCIAAMEAMAAGVPVVTSDRGAICETVVDGVGGCVVEFSESAEFLQRLQNAVEGLWQDAEKYHDLSRSAYHRAWECFDWKAVAAQWDEALFTTAHQL